MRGLPIWPPVILFCVVTACVEMNPYRSPRCEHFGFSTKLRCILKSSETLFEVINFTKPYKHFVSFHVSFWASSKLILTFTKWGGVACKITSVHGIQLPSTVDNFRQHLLHHDTSFIAFSTKELKIEGSLFFGSLYFRSSFSGSYYLKPVFDCIIYCY